jgi:hypothetical protein
MRAKSWTRGLVTAGALLLGLAVAASSWAQNMFYQEIEKDGRIYVFALMKEYESFDKSGEMGKAITRLGYGPNNETVVFDSEDAINYYNFKHNKPGEVFAKPKEAVKSPYPSGKIIGLAFGDFYYFSDHHDAKFDGQEGFWLRRAYLGYDHAFSSTISARLRLEMNSNGQLAGGNLVPFVKDAYVTWKYSGKHQARLGIQPSLTFDSEEGFWGLRHIEKTPADLYKIDSSRDFALSLSGPLGDGGFSYAAQFGNDSSNGSETDKYKVARFLGLFEAKSGLRVEGAFNYGKRPNGQDRTTAKGLVGFKNKEFRLAGEYLWQERKSGKTGTPDTKINIWSAFGVWDFSPKKASAFGRFDSVKGKVASTEVGLPGADGIDYLVLSAKSPFKAYIFGLEFHLNGLIRLSPNVEIVNYDDSAITKDVVPRLTFYWTW